jgi:hypothetical protein
MRTFRSAITEYTVRDDGIWVGREINLDVPRTPEIVGASLDRLREETGGQRVPGMWDARHVPEFSPAVWTAFLARIEDVVVALAILTAPGVVESLGAFPAAIDSLILPVRLFESEDEAVAWLQAFVDRDSTADS